MYCSQSEYNWLRFKTPCDLNLPLPSVRVITEVPEAS